jgi:Transport and Golgi organisation 2
VLVAGVRDEFLNRAWQPPGPHWPEYPGFIGGRDLLAGGTWLAMAPHTRRVACVLNARGTLAPAGSRRSRGVLPLRAAAGDKLERAALAGFDPFHLLTAEPGWAALASWDGGRLTERELPTGLHVIVNSGLGAELVSPAEAGISSAEEGTNSADGGAGPGNGGSTAGRANDSAAGRGTSWEAEARRHEAARAAYFLPRLRAAEPPDPKPGDPAPQAWGTWFPLLNGDGIGPDDPRALIVRRDLADGRVWGTTSISLVALSPAGVRYDFTGRPGDPSSWYPVPL